MLTFPGLGELASEPARAHVSRDAASRPHDFVGDRCARCQMLRSWPGARYACEGTEYSSRVARCAAIGFRGQCVRMAVRGDFCPLHGRRR